jgi:hypothetical protein
MTIIGFKKNKLTPQGTLKTLSGLAGTEAVGCTSFLTEEFYAYDKTPKNQASKSQASKSHADCHKRH